jgi:hypothetical protein
LKTNERDICRGIKAWNDTEDNITRLRIHYSADDAKNPLTPEGAKWVEEGKKNAPSIEWWNQEQEIDFGARQGARVYHAFKDDETQLVDDFAIPPEWTRYFILDTHPRKPHAMLWVAVSPDGIAYVYRELWPSKVYGTNKNIPEDDNNYPIKWYCEAIKWIESDDNPENGGKKEKIYKRIIDYAARAFGKDRDNPDAIDYQERYENYSKEIGHYLVFEDCLKDNEANYAEVNEWLRPMPTLDKTGNSVQRSRLRIFKSLIELRWELLNNRIQMLQPHQVDTKDPGMKVIDKRNDCSDCLKYFCAAKPMFVKKKKRIHTASHLAVR